MSGNNKGTPFGDVKSPEELFRSIERKLPFLRNELSGNNNNSSSNYKKNSSSNSQFISGSVVSRGTRGRGKSTRSSTTSHHVDEAGGGGRKLAAGKKRRGTPTSSAGVIRTKRNKTLEDDNASISLNGDRFSDTLKQMDANAAALKADSLPNRISADTILQNMSDKELINTSSVVFDLFNSIHAPRTSSSTSNERVSVSSPQSIGSIDPQSLVPPPLANIETGIVNKPVPNIDTELVNKLEIVNKKPQTKGAVEIDTGVVNKPIMNLEAELVSKPVDMMANIPDMSCTLTSTMVPKLTAKESVSSSRQGTTESLSSSCSQTESVSTSKCDETGIDDVELNPHSPPPPALAVIQTQDSHALLGVGGEMGVEGVGQEDGVGGRDVSKDDGVSQP